MFKNIKFFLLNKPIDLSAPDNEKQLDDNRFVPCTSQELTQNGWVPPLGKHAEYVLHQAAGNIWLTMQKEDKLLPASVINQAVDEKVAELEQQSGTPVSKKQKRDLKEDITFQLLPKAFSKFSRTSGVVSDDQGLLWVDAGSDNKAEEFCSLLRQSLGSLPLSQFETSTSPAVLMTCWLLENDLPEGFELEDEAELRDSAEDGGIIRCKQQVLNDEEVLAHLRSGKQVSQLRLTWDNTITFTLCADMTLKRLRFTDVVAEQNDDFDDMVAKLDADFALMSGEINRLVKRLMEVFHSDE